jgi:hypothetical protein
MPTARLSVFIITYNEAQDLPECLASVAAIADEIVVVDQGSSDDTCSIAEAAGARVITRAFDGFGAQKQAALEACTGEWVLSIDADERLTAPLSDEIDAATRSTGVNGYRIRRQVYYLGKRLRFGGTGSEWLPRLARRAHARFTPARVHERLIIDGPVGRLQSPMLHLTYHDLSEHLHVIDRYTTALAIDKTAARVSSLSSAAHSPRAVHAPCAQAWVSRWTRRHHLERYGGALCVSQIRKVVSGDPTFRRENAFCRSCETIASGALAVTSTKGA